MKNEGKPKCILVKITKEAIKGGKKRMVKRLGYHHVALRAKDFEATVRFYEAIGCQMLREWGEGEKKACMMDVGGSIIEIFAGGTGEEEIKPHFEHIALRSEDVPADYANALANGARPRMEPGEANLGGNYPINMAFVYGLNDEVIEFFREK